MEDRHLIMEDHHLIMEDRHLIMEDHHLIMEDLHTTSPVTTAQMTNTGLTDPTSITGQITRMGHTESLQGHLTGDLKEINQSMEAHLTMMSRILMDLLMGDLLEITSQNTMKGLAMKAHHTIRSLGTEDLNTAARNMKVHLPTKGQASMALMEDLLVAVITPHRQATSTICKEMNHHSMDLHIDLTMVSPKLSKS
jgi:hypothetical protein